MPSSPEATAWQLEELRPQTHVATLDRSPRPAGNATRAAVFELSTAAGIPAELLISARESARSAGYAAGWSSGIQAARLIAAAEAETARAERERADRERGTRLHQAITAINGAADALEARSLPTAEQFEDLIITSALAIAEQLVGHVLRDDEARSHGVLAHALALAPDREDVEIRLHPADHAALVADDAVASHSQSRAITLIADPTLRPGDAVARCGATEIDARIVAGLARIREVLGR
jgi:flagellar assembly protein FliH